MNKFKFKHIWLLLVGVMLASLVLGVGQAQYAKEISKSKQKQTPAQPTASSELIENTSLSEKEDQETNTSNQIKISSSDTQTSSENQTEENKNTTTENQETTTQTDEQKETQDSNIEYVNLNINSIGSYKIEYSQNDTGWDIMQKAAKKYVVPMTYQIYDFGIMIQSIGGIKPQYGSYWALYHNSSYSMVGIKDLQVSPEDTITWVVESWM